MACRNEERALDARERVLIALDTELLRRKRDNRGVEDAYARTFRERVQIDFVRLDLENISSVFEFCDVVKSKYIPKTDSCINKLIIRFPISAGIPTYLISYAMLQLALSLGLTSMLLHGSGSAIPSEPPPTQPTFCNLQDH